MNTGVESLKKRGAMTVIGVSTLLRKWRKYNKGVDYGQFILIVCCLE